MNSLSDVISYISDRHPRGNYAKPLIEGSKFAQSAWREGSRTFLLVGQADFGAAPSHPEPIRFYDARRASPIFHPSPRPFRALDLDKDPKDRFKIAVVCDM
jgi:hypothetical protein